MADDSGISVKPVWKQWKRWGAILAVLLPIANSALKLGLPNEVMGMVVLAIVLLVGVETYKDTKIAVGQITTAMKDVEEKKP